MIKNVNLSICDNCDIVSVAPEYTICKSCGRVMAHVKFIREDAQQSGQWAAADRGGESEGAGRDKAGDAVIYPKLG
jgi:hypothetical protein